MIDSAGPINTDIRGNVLRTAIGLNLEGSAGIKLMVSHESKLGRHMSLILKGGTFFTGEEVLKAKLPDYTYSYHFAIRIIASGELRYYYNLKRRLKLLRTIQNFSAPYFSIEPFYMSSTFTMVKRTHAETNGSSTGAYLNFGFQKQVKEMCINFFGGCRLPGPIYKSFTSWYQLLHAGILIGAVID